MRVRPEPLHRRPSGSAILEVLLYEVRALGTTDFKRGSLEINHTTVIYSYLATHSSSRTINPAKRSTGRVSSWFVPRCLTDWNGKRDGATIYRISGGVFVANFVDALGDSSDKWVSCTLTVCIVFMPAVVSLYRWVAIGSAS